MSVSNSAFSFAIALALCVIPTPADATRVFGPRTTAFWTGSELQRKLSIGRPWKEKTPDEEIEVTEGLSYLFGAVDAIEGTSACILASGKDPDITEVVLSYMLANPSRLSDPAAVLVKDALSAAFPCSAQP
jgi:hypothetical protein